MSRRIKSADGPVFRLFSLGVFPEICDAFLILRYCLLYEYKRYFRGSLETGSIDRHCRNCWITNWIMLNQTSNFVDWSHDERELRDFSSILTYVYRCYYQHYCTLRRCDAMRFGRILSNPMKPWRVNFHRSRAPRSFARLAWRPSDVNSSARRQLNTRRRSALPNLTDVLRRANRVSAICTRIFLFFFLSSFSFSTAQSYRLILRD